jgi:antitoxin VapB
MSLNIKDQETHDLVKELANLTGTSLTSAVRDAVREVLDREKANRDKSAPQPRSRYELLMDFAREYSGRMKDPVHSWEINNLLYDEDGLPK